MQWTPARIFAIVLAVAYLGVAVWLQDWPLVWGLCICLIFSTSMILFADKFGRGLMMGAAIAQMFPGREEQAVFVAGWIFHLLPGVLLVFKKLPEHF